MDNKIIISKSKLIKSLNFSESNRLILGTSGEGQPIHWKREMIMDEYANIGAAKISDNDKWIVINSDSNELTFVPKDKNDTELVICKNVCLKKDGEDTHVLLIFQKSGELLSKARKYIKSNNDRFYNLALDLRPGVKEQINQESDVEVQQLIDKILQVESEEELSLYDRIIARLLQSIILYFLETGKNDGLPEKLSVIIKDEDGKLYESTKDNLRQKGYKIKELEFKKFINSDTDIQRQIEDIKTIRSEILENATAEIESIDFLQRASDNLRSKEDSNEELIELLLPSLLLLHMEMSSYLREEAEWSQLLNNKTALYVTGRTCDHGEYSVLYAILSTYYEMVLKNHIVFITEGNIK